MMCQPFILQLSTSALSSHSYLQMCIPLLFQSMDWNMGTSRQRQVFLTSELPDETTSLGLMEQFMWWRNAVLPISNVSLHFQQVLFMPPHCSQWVSHPKRVHKESLVMSINFLKLLGWGWLGSRPHSSQPCFYMWHVWSTPDAAYSGVIPVEVTTSFQDTLKRL